MGLLNKSVWLCELELEAALIKHQYEMTQQIYERIINLKMSDEQKSLSMIDYNHFMEEVRVRTEMLKANIEIHRLQQAEEKARNQKNKFLGLF